MSDALDDFIEEMRALGKGDARTMEEITTFFHALKHDNNPAMIQMYDDVVDIVRRRSPLSEREIAIVKLLSAWLQ